MARVYPLRETTIHPQGDWALWFQWCRYDLDDGIQYGYRFIWKRKDGSLQAARGQARIPTIADARELLKNAEAAGWGDRSGKLMEEAVERLKAQGCVAELGSAHVRWPTREAAEAGQLSKQMLDDARLLQMWS
jgi:hypothetical protein